MDSASLKSGKCPKCGSDDIHSNIELNGIMAIMPHRMTVGPMTDVQLEVCVCGHCGYLEQYVAYANELEQLTEIWPRIDLGAEEE